MTNILRVLTFGSVFVTTLTVLYTNKYQQANLFDLLYQSYMAGTPVYIRLFIYTCISAIVSLCAILCINPIILKIKKYIIQVEWNTAAVKKKIKIRFGIILAIILFLSILLQIVLVYSPVEPIKSLSKVVRIIREKKLFSEETKSFLNYNLIAHAGGGIDGFTYTNSREALDLNYSLGHRVFEIDLNLMPDGKILCSHDIIHLNSITGVNTSLQATEQYKIKKIYNRYTVIDLEDLFVFMRHHPDMYLVTDSKLADSNGYFTDNDEYNRKFWVEFVSAARKIDDQILLRVIPQLYYPKMLEIVDSIYPFSRYIFTLYATSLTADPILKFAFEHPKIAAITMPPGRLEDHVLVNGLRRLGRPIYVHTINSEVDVVQYIRKGVYGFYTDFLTPSQFDNIINPR